MSKNSHPTQMACRKALAYFPHPLSSLSVAVSLAFQPLWLLSAQAAPPAPNALPVGGQVVAGQALITQTGQQMLVQQNSPKLITNWQSFNVGSQAAVVFQQPGNASVALNRVLAGDASQIMGKLSSNGQVFLINPQGVVFGNTARVDVGGLMVSSLPMADKDFLSGNYQFGGSAIDAAQAGLIRNEGQIQGRYVVLVAPEIENSGRIEAAQGQVGLLAGSGAKLQLDAQGLVSVQLDASTRARIDNSGAILADGGRVLMSAQAAAPGLAAAINQSGTVRADSLQQRNGEIWLDGGRGRVELQGQTLAQGGQGLSGGKIVATAAQVAVDGRVDASGQQGGGTVLLGGGVQGKDASVREAGTIGLSANSVVAADALSSGQGGQVVVWSAERSSLAGQISAKGAGSAKGGFIETSSRGQLDVGGRVHTGAGGTWLLDPASLTIDSSNKAVYEGQLNAGGNVLVQADNTININDDLSKTAGGDATLQFKADGVVSLASGKAISSLVGKLNIDFCGSATGACSTVGGGSVNLAGQLATNGGNVHFYKDTTLASSAPISTKLLGVSSGASGDVVFHKDVTLASSTLGVNISSQGAQSGSTYVGTGGLIDFQGKIKSGVVAGIGSLVPQGLTLDTTGTVPGAITLGDSVGTVAAPLGKLVLAGPTEVALNAAEVNLRATSGDVLTASSALGTPKLVLGAANTDIRVTGGTVNGVTGYADYKQETFDIGVKDASARTLTITSDRSIKIKNRSIDGETNAGSNPLILNLQAYQADAAGGGAIHLNNATLKTNGGALQMGGSGTAANGAAVGTANDPDGNTDGIQIFNSQIASKGGTISLNARAPDSLAGGAGVHIFGLSTLDSGSGSLSIQGAVNQASSAGNKDAVLIGEGSSSQVSLLASGNGAISIQGDASGVGSNVTSGSRYDGVIISQGALVQTAAGNIRVIGKGGGGNDYVSDQNHGVRLDTLNTRVLSGSGNILIGGVAGGKMGSYGVFAAGNAMWLGRLDGGSATGNIDLVADSLFLTNSSSARLKAASSGELRLRTWTDSRDILLGSADSNGWGSALGLSSSWFSGSNAIFQGGFSHVTVGGAAEAPVAGKGTLTVDAATTVRDNLNLAMQGSGGKVQVNAALTVQGASGVANADKRTVSLRVDQGATGAGLLSVDKLQLIGKGDFVLSGPNLVGTLAGNGLDGQVAFNNAQALSVGSVGSTSYGVANGPAVGLSTINDKAVTLSTSAGNLSLDQSIQVGQGRVSLQSLAGAVNETGSAIVSADQLAVQALNGGSLMNANTVRGLAARVNGSNQDLSFKNQGALTLETVAATPAINVAAVSGVSVSGTAWLESQTGGITQTEAVQASKLGLQTQGDIALDLQRNGVAPNRVGTVAARTTNGEFKLLNGQALTIGAVGTAAAGSTLAGIDTSSAARGVRVDVANGNLVLANSVNAGSASVSLSATTGGVNELHVANAPETTAPIITAGRLQVSAQDHSDLSNDNAVGVLAVNMVGAAKDFTFVAKDGLRIDSVSDIGGRQVDGLNVSGNAWLQAKNGTITQTQAVKAGGLAAKASGAITLDLGAGATPSNLIGKLAAASAGGTVNVLNNAALQVSSVGTAAGNALAGAPLQGVSTNNQDITLRTAQGRMGLDQSITAGSAVLSLEAAAGVQQSGGILSADRLRVLATGSGAIDLQQAGNRVRVLAASAADGSIAYRDADALEVGSVTVALGGLAGSTVGVTSAATGKDQLLKTGGALTLSQNLAAGRGVVNLESATGGIAQVGGVIQADKVRVLAEGSGAVDLQNANTVGVLAARVQSGTLAFNNAAALTVGSVTRSLGAPSSDATIAGVNTAAGNQQQLIKSAGKLSLEQGLAAGTAMVNLEAANGGIQQTGGVISADSLRVLAGGSGAVDLQKANAVNVLAAKVQGGTLAFNNAQALSVGSLTRTVGQGAGVAVAGVDTSAGNGEQLIKSAGKLNLAQTLSAGSATLSLEVANGGIQQSAGVISADKLRILSTGSGDVTLQQANQVANLAAQVNGGKLAFNNAQALTIAALARTVGADAGVSLAGLDTSAANKDQRIQSSGALTLAQGLKAGKGTVELLASNGGISQTGGSVSAAQLKLTAEGSGNVDLQQANAVGTLSAKVNAGELDFVNAGALTLAAVDTAAGNKAQRIRSGGKLTLTEQLQAGSGSISLESATGGIAQTAGSVQAGQLNLRAQGSGDADLQQANRVGTLAANVAGGSLNFRNAAELNLAAIDTSGANKDQRIVSAGRLSLSDAVNAGSGTVNLESAAGGITQTAGLVKAGKLNVAVQGTGNADLQQANRVGTLSAVLADGALSFENAQALTVGVVNTAAGNKDQLIKATGGLTLTDQLLAGKGVVNLEVQGGGIRQTGGVLSADKLRVQATGAEAVELRQANRLASVAARTEGAFALETAQSLNVAEVGNTKGVQAGGEVYIRAAGDLGLDAAVRSTAASQQAVVLAATQAFRNRAGAQAVQADAGRWLIYDDNPALDLSRLGGLPFAFMQTGVTLASLPPQEVLGQGSGYLTTAKLLPPEQFARLVGGTTQAENSGNLATHIGASRPLAASLSGPAWSQTDAAQELAPKPLAQDGSRLQSAWSVKLQAGQRFVSDVAALLGQTPAGLEKLQVSDGANLPAWLHYDADKRQFAGLVPPDLAKPIRVRVQMQAAKDQAPQAFELDFVP